MVAEKAEILENMQRKLLTAKRKLKQAIQMVESSLDDHDRLRNLEKGQMEERK